MKKHTVIAKGTNWSLVVKRLGHGISAAVFEVENQKFYVCQDPEHDHVLFMAAMLGVALARMRGRPTLAAARAVAQKLRYPEVPEEKE